jgi:hypothetical protein
MNGKAMSLNNFVIAYGKCNIALFAGRHSTDLERETTRKNLPKATKKGIKQRTRNELNFLFRLRQIAHRSFH